MHGKESPIRSGPSARPRQSHDPALSKPGFTIHVDPDRTTNGQRFWENLAANLQPTASWDDAKTVLLNVSVPISVILRARLAGKRIILRLDGIYFDRLSAEFIRVFRSLLLRRVLTLCARSSTLQKCGAFLANLLNRNYGT